MPNHTVKFPRTAREWELFSGEPGAEAAAQRLVQATLEAFDSLDKRVASGESVVSAIRAVFALLDLQLERDAEFGAGDSEPRYHAARALCEYGAAIIGSGTWQDLYHTAGL